MATLRIKKKIAAMNRDNNEDPPRNIQTRNTYSLGIQEDYIAQVSEEIESRVANTLSPEFSKTENRFLGALSRLDEFLQNPQPRARSGTVLETSQNLRRENQETNEDGSQNDPQIEVGVSLSHSPQELSPEETSYSDRYFRQKSTTTHCNWLNVSSSYILVAST